MELTKEHFDDILSGLATKEDVAGLATKEDLTALELRFDRKVDDLARMVQEGFSDIALRLDVRERVGQHDRDIQDLKRAVNLA